MALSEHDIPDLMTRAQAAEFMGISITTLDRMVRNHELEAHKLRGSIRISPAACVDALNRRSTLAGRRAARARR
jgi:excisionase family DNA binding protein